MTEETRESKKRKKYLTISHWKEYRRNFHLAYSCLLLGRPKDIDPTDHSSYINACSLTQMPAWFLKKYSRCEKKCEVPADIFRIIRLYQEITEKALKEDDLVCYVFVDEYLPKIQYAVQASHAVANLMLKQNKRIQRWATSDKTIVLFKKDLNRPIEKDCPIVYQDKNGPIYLTEHNFWQKKYKLIKGQEHWTEFIDSDISRYSTTAVAVLLPRKQGKELFSDCSLLTI